MDPVAKQDSSIANSVAESLSNVVEKSLHASSKESPVKLFHGAAHRGARSPQLPEGGVVPGCDVTMKRDLKEIAVQLDNLNVPVMGFVSTSRRNARSPRTATTITITTRAARRAKGAERRASTKTDPISTK